MGIQSWTYIIVGVTFAVYIGIAIWSKQRQNKTGQTFPVFYSSVGLVLSFFFLSMLATGFPLTFEYPELKGFNFKGGIKLIPELVALTLPYRCIPPHLLLKLSEPVSKLYH